MRLQSLSVVRYLPQRRLDRPKLWRSSVGVVGRVPGLREYTTGDAAVSATAELPPRAMTPELARAIDAVLLAAHTLRHSLKEGHVPLGVSLAAAVRVYGAESPLLGLWMAIKAHAALERAWTGESVDDGLGPVGADDETGALSE